MKQIVKRSLSFVLALCLIMTLLPGIALGAKAAELSGLSDAGIVVEYTAATKGGTVAWTGAGNSIEGSVKGKLSAYYQAEESTMTITNGKSTAAVLSFDFTTSTATGTVTVDGTSYTGAKSGSVSKELAPGASITVALKVTTRAKAQGQNSAIIKITNLSLVADRDATTTFQHATGGSYTVTDASGVVTPITGNTQLVQNSTKAYTLTAQADSGYQFFGWYNVTTGAYIAYDAVATYQSDADNTIKPVFISNTAAVFQAGNAKFTDLGEAAAFAKANSIGMVVLINSGTISGDHTIPAGVTLLIPFDEQNTCYTSEPANTGGTGGQATPWVQPYAYKTLTLASNASITVNGAISVSGQHSAGSSSNGGVSYVGCPSGPVGFIDMAKGSEIVINNGGAAYVWGYIIGEGEITAKSGATVYENMQFTDFRGGSATLLLADPEGLGGMIGVFPLSQYYVQNIEVRIELESGANEYVYTSLFMSGMALSSGVKFIGTGAMFVAESGGSVSKQYIPSQDRLLIEVDGQAQINSLSLELAGNQIDSSNYTLPINSNITININSGKTVVNQNMALTPGSVVNVAAGAELSVAEGWSIYIYDRDQWFNYYVQDAEGNPIPASGGGFVSQGRNFIPVPYSPTRSYNRTDADLTDVQLNVNGKLVADGWFYTTDGGANVTTSEKTGVVYLASGLNEEYVVSMAEGWGFYTYQAIQQDINIIPAGIPITSIKLHNADGSYTDTEDAQPGDGYIWNANQAKWVKAADATVSFNANGGSGSMNAITVTKDQMIAGNAKATLAANAFTRTGYTFQGWATSADGAVVYADGASVSVAEDVTLYAVWKINTYNVTFQGTNVTSAGAATVQHGNAYTANLTVASCNALSASDITVTAGGKTVSGVTYANGVLTIPASAVTGDIVITATAVTSHTSGAPVRENEVAPTCKDFGSYEEVVYCSVCNAEISRTTKPIDKLTVHTPGQAVTENASKETCEQGGSYDTVVYCSVCGVELSRVTTTIQATGHTYAGVITAPTCEGKGYTTYTCSVCGDSYVGDEVAATGHKYTNYTGNNDATCTRDGTKTASCDNKCGKKNTINDAGSMLGHNYTSKVTAPTCEAEGYTTYTCTRGDHTYTADKVAATGHKYTSYISNGDATCTKDGTKTASCDNKCGKKDTVTDTGSALGHEYTSKVTAPTCEAEGYTTYTCTRGDHTYTADKVAATGHKYTNYISNGDATCTKDGTKTASCDNKCGKKDTVTDTGSALNHEYTSKVTAPTCEAEGYTTYTCVRGDHSYVADRVNALGHSYTKYVSNSDATCTKDGTKTAACDNKCGKKDTVADEGSALGHEYTSKVTAPTCEAEGYTTYTCVRGDHSYVADRVNALGHSYTKYVSNSDATCTKDGTKTAACDNKCGKKDTVADEGSALGHDYKAVVTAPACTEGGYTTHTCSRCADSYVDSYTDATGHNYVSGKCVCGDVLKFTVTFVDVDGTVLETDTVEYGQMPSYDGKIPTKENSATSTFTFSGWTPAAAAVTGDVTYTAVYTENLKNGLFAENGGIYHYVEGKLSYAGLIEIDGEYYYVRTTTGALVTDRTYWATYTNDLLPEGNYKFDKDGKIVFEAPKNGFVSENGGIYHYVDGVLSCAGLIQVDGAYYYVRTTTGEVVTGRTYWITVTNDLLPEGNYNFDAEGKIVFADPEPAKDGFVEENGAIYYYEDGVMVKSGLIKVDGYYYYIRTTTGEVVTGRTYWVTYTNDLMDEGNYVFDSKGRMINPPDGSYVQPEDEVIKDGFIKEDGKLYYYEDGVMVKSGLIKVGKYYYYVRTTTGEVVTGRTYWVTYTNGLMDEGNYKFDSKGRMILN